MPSRAPPLGEPKGRPEKVPREEPCASSLFDTKLISLTFPAHSGSG
jgi:hypothetical protein